MVGAVVARGDRPLAEAWHERFGGPHAEARALANAGPDARGATLYVTLEPCCHHGKTPPCTDAVLASGVARVVVAMADPFPEVAGRGLARLRDAGLVVQTGLMEAEARRLNAPFIKRHTTGRPYVIAKWAQTLDGRLAADSGDSRWISSPRSRQWVHELRSRVDAVVIGAGTALADNPLLTVRLEPGRTDYGRRPARVVLDDRLDLPPASRLAATAGEVPLVVATRTDAADARAAELARRGADILRLPADARGICIAALLDDLGRRGMTNVLVEGGRTVLSSFFRAEAIDRLAVFIAPKLIGGRPRHAAPGPDGLADMGHAVQLLRHTVTEVGGDALIEGVLRDY
jgi:diaminohydroxyphosphoribosylaminopyrimidine deaminase/5-amino-6-(5-phosphoribosylamino)uracil reductase